MSAMLDYEEALALDASLAMPHWNRGKIFQLKKDNKRALEEYTKAIELDPSHRDAHIDLASTLLGFGNAEAAGLLGISPRKANQVWAYARAWLLDELSS